jgi:hypothetical protein
MTIATLGFNEICFCECKPKLWEIALKKLTSTYAKGTNFNSAPRFIESSHWVVVNNTFVFLNLLLIK